jgi:hypothetical protein
MKVLQKVATTPMRKSAREPEACFFAYAARVSHECVLAREVHGGRALSRGVLQKCVERCGGCGG